MHDVDAPPERAAQLCGELLGQDHRAMPPPGAANSDGQVALALAFEARNRKLQQVGDLGQQLLRLGLAQDEVTNAGVGSWDRLQLGNEEGIVQKPHVEDQVGVHRRPVFEPERDKARVHPRCPSGTGPEDVEDRAAEIVHAEAGGVEDARGARAQRRQPLALESDAREHVGRGVGLRRSRERVRAPRAGEAAEQGGVRRVQEQNRELAARRNDGVDDATDVVEEAAHADVDAEGHPPEPALLERLDGGGQHQGRHVVDAEEPEVLQGVQRRRLARPGHAREHHDQGRRRHFLRSPPVRRVAAPSSRSVAARAAA